MIPFDPVDIFWLFGSGLELSSFTTTTDSNGQVSIDYTTAEVTGAEPVTEHLLVTAVIGGRTINKVITVLRT